MILNTDDPVEIFYKILDIHVKIKPGQIIDYFQQRGIPDKRVREVIWREIDDGNILLTPDRYITRRKIK